MIVLRSGLGGIYVLAPGDLVDMYQVSASEGGAVFEIRARNQISRVDTRLTRRSHPRDKARRILDEIVSRISLAGWHDFYYVDIGEIEDSA